MTAESVLPGAQPLVEVGPEAAMVLAYDPELVVLGGIVGLADEAYVDIIRSELGARCLYPPTVVRASFGEDAVVRGAGMQALTAVEIRRFP